MKLPAFTALALFCATVLPSAHVLSQSTAPTPAPSGSVFVPITSRASLIAFPNHQKPIVSKAGSKAAAVFYEALDTGDKAKAAEAHALFRGLVEKESFGNEYLAFIWFCDYLMAGPDARKAMLTDPITKAYFEFLGGDNFKILKIYLRTSFGVAGKGAVAEAEPSPGSDQPEPVKKLRVLFGLEPARVTPADEHKEENATPDLPPPREVVGGVSEEDVAFWRDFILFNNPLRPVWEKTDGILNLVHIQPGETVLDIGCGPGFFSMRFSKMVGPDGKIFAIDTNEKHLEFLATLISSTGAKNIETVRSKFDDVCVPEHSVDRAFMCSLYSVIYIVSMEQVKDRFIASIRKALKPGGKLIIVDNNAVVPEGVVPYHGSRIEPSLVIAQLSHYGFKLVNQQQIIPQRYLLEFERDAAD